MLKVEAAGGPIRGLPAETEICHYSRRRQALQEDQCGSFTAAGRSGDARGGGAGTYCRPSRSKQMRYTRSYGAAAVCMAAALLSPLLARGAAAQRDRIDVPADAIVRLELDQRISSRTAGE